MKTINILIGISAIVVSGVSQSYANDHSVIGHTAVATASAGLTQNQMDSAESRLPMLTDPSQLPQEVQELLNNSDSPFQSSAYGSENHPFTTKRATTRHGPQNTLKKFPYRAAGKLFMEFGATTYVCSASVIDKNLLVTAAHCVAEFGGGFADAVYFQPATHDGGTPFGKWTATDWYVPTVYHLGTDVCTTAGVVCENDLALVVLGQNNGEDIQDVLDGSPAVSNGALNLFKYGQNNFSYTSFNGLTATQLTQLGYPIAHDGGLIMMRTDSLAYQATPSNVIIGSDQTGGSSGGPWIANFGVASNYSGATTATGSAGNRVIATTSWGYVSDALKIQGASRFSTNTAFPTASNIQTLVTVVCDFHPGACN